MNEIEQWLKVLDLEVGASKEEVRRAWLDMAQVWHPDRFSGNDRLQAKAEERLKLINEAYEHLRKAELPKAPKAAPQAEPKGPKYEPQMHTVREQTPDPDEVLQHGVSEWNMFRRKYSNVVPKMPRRNFARAQFEGIDMREADLSGVNFENADLYKANLTQAMLTGARMAGADLSRALLIEAVLVNVDFSNANMSSADLRGADLEGAQLKGVNLVSARLEGANLSGAKGLEARQLQLASIDYMTKLPSFSRS